MMREFKAYLSEHRDLIFTMVILILWHHYLPIIILGCRGLK